MNEDEKCLLVVDEQGQLRKYRLDGFHSTYLDVTNLDPIVLKTVIELISRSRVGVTKYGTTLHENHADDFLQHAKEEALDLANYLTKLQSEQK